MRLKIKTRVIALIAICALGIAVVVDALLIEPHVALSGHTHGGQVRLPLLSPFWLPPSCGRYVDGWYEQKGSRMYVSRGIGTSILPVRFLCRPEIAIIMLEPQ